MEVLSAKKYIEKQTAKWEKDWKKALDGGRHHSMLPQLAFYLFNPQRKYGYVAFNDKKALWAKSKAEVIEYWNDEERKRKVRGW